MVDNSFLTPSNRYITPLDLLPATLAALGGTATVLACDPSTFSSPLLPASARRVPLDCGLTGQQLRLLASRAPTAIALSPVSSFPVRVRLPAPATVACRVSGGLPEAPEARVRVTGAGEAILSPPGARPVTLERLARALREEGIAVMRQSVGEKGELLLEVPACGARVELREGRVKLAAASRDAWLLLSRALTRLERETL
jgi:hypothetical protein